MTNIIICGCGALGSQIAMNILDPEHNYTLIDDDRVELENLLTSAYNISDRGALKANVLATKMIFRMGIFDMSVIPTHKTIISKRQITSKLTKLRLSDNLIIDTFDNISARGFTVGFDVPTVHVSIGEHGIGAIEWNDVFNLPSKGYPRGENPVCTNQLGRNLVLLTASVASVIINQFLATEKKESVYVNVDGLEVYK